MKKILLVHHSGLIGGAGISLYYLWKALSKKYEVVCYVAKNPDNLSRFLDDKGYRANPIPFQLGKITYYSGGNSLTNPRFWYHIAKIGMQIDYWRRVVRTEKPDLVIVNSKVLCWMGVLFRKVKSMCFVRETILGSPYSVPNLLIRRMLDKFTRVIFLSQYDLNATGLKIAGASVVPDYLEIEDYRNRIGKNAACSKLGINPETFNVLYVGGMNKIKGIDIALEAMNQLKDEDITLVIAGSDYTRNQRKGILSLIAEIKKMKLVRFSDRMKKFIARHHIEDKIKFIGIQEDMSVPYSACDVLIFPMREPHQSRPAFEFGTQKKPIIITDFPNIREYFIDEVNGLTFRPNDPMSLAKAITRLRRNDELRGKLGNSNYQFTEDLHNQRAAVQKINEIVEGILD